MTKMRMGKMRMGRMMEKVEGKKNLSSRIFDATFMTTIQWLV